MQKPIRREATTSSIRCALCKFARGGKFAHISPQPTQPAASVIDTSRAGLVGISPSAIFGLFPPAERMG